MANEAYFIVQRKYFRFLLLFLLYLFHKDRAPKTVARLWIQLFQMQEDGLHIRTAGSLFVRTQRLLLSEMQLFCYLPDIRLMYETERTDNGKRIMFQRKTGLHGGMRTLEGDVHQQGNEDIIHVMSQSYLIEPVAYSKLEERLASVPGTEEATGLSGIGGFIERTMKDMELDAILCTCLLYTSPSPRDGLLSRMPSSA